MEAPAPVAQSQILVLEDDPDTSRLLQHSLRRHGFAPTVVENVGDCREALNRLQPDLIVSDLNLPDGDGLDLLREIRAIAVYRRTPVIIVSGREAEGDVLDGFASGADDYITKPFSPRVLLARIRAVLRGAALSAAPSPEDQPIVYAGISIDPRRFEIAVDGALMEFTPNEQRVLQLLCGEPGRVRSRREILDCLHGEETGVSPRSVDVLIASLRKKLGRRCAWLETVRGAGYRAADLARAELLAASAARYVSA